MNLNFDMIERVRIRSSLRSQTFKVIKNKSEVTVRSEKNHVQRLGGGDGGVERRGGKGGGG